MARKDPGEALAGARRSVHLSRLKVTRALEWPRSRVELVERGRVWVEVEVGAVLANPYGVKAKGRAALVNRAEETTRT